MATGLSVIVIAAVVLLNVVVGILADRFPLTFDLTKDKTFSLSEQGAAVADSTKRMSRSRYLRMNPCLPPPPRGWMR